MNVLKLIVSVSLPLLVGWWAVVASGPAVTGWYLELAKPPLNPPSWVFGPVWTTLYVLMGVAAFLVWQYGWRRPDVRRALGLFLAQLVLNSVWSVIFFGLQSPAWALVDLLLLWTLIVLTAVAFSRISKPAGWLLVPYLAWVSFAGYLNAGIVILN